MTERLVEAEWGCWEVGARCSPFHPYDPSDPEFRPHPGVRQGAETEVRAELGLEGPSSQDLSWLPRNQSFISRPGGLYLDTSRSGVP